MRYILPVFYRKKEDTDSERLPVGDLLKINQLRGDKVI